MQTGSKYSTLIDKDSLTRPALLANSADFGTSFAVGNGFVAAKAATDNWAVEVQHLRPETMATLARMARDIYAHDKVSDAFYVVAVKRYDTPHAAPAVEAGIAGLNASAQALGYAAYIDIAREQDRVDLLRGIENSAFYQRIRRGLVSGLYTQKTLWPGFGQEDAIVFDAAPAGRTRDRIDWL